MKYFSWKHVLFCLVLPGAFIASCGGDDALRQLNDSIPVKGISLPSSVAVNRDEPLSLRGIGILSSDQVELAGKDGNGPTVVVPVSEVHADSFSILLPGDFVSGTYGLTLIRDGKRLPMGTLNINLTSGVEVPDREGMTVKGVVECDGRGVAGVVVSDGFEVATTDADGIYYLPSQKKNGYVFISIPPNYEVECKNGNEPQFFKRLTRAAGVSEQQDFALRAVDNTHHKLFVMTDFHLANRNDDLKQYDNFVEDVNAAIASESASGTRVYGVDLGDLSWDLYWYSNDFALPRCMAEADKIDCPVFHLPGNHDNDPYMGNDWDAEQAYKNEVCPTYYSFNLGDVHYVMLDNVKYVNTGGAQGQVGDRSYDGTIVPEQMEWLRKDLSHVTDKNTPIVVCMHVNLYRNPSVVGGNQVDWISLDNGRELKELLSAYSNVQVLTGHTHVNFTVEQDNWMEHNVAAVCATWWWTGKDGYAGNHTCKDGSPGGYAVWDVDGTTRQWYYKGTGLPRDYQFRAYDLNECHITAEKYAPKSTDEKLAPYVGSYAGKRSDNKVLINVWNYDSGWKVEVSEDGRPLPVTRVSAKDPLHLISYEALRLNAGATPTESFETDTTGHMFEVTASSPTSTLDIRVTDRFGRTYTERMIRPKALTCDMR